MTDTLPSPAEAVARLSAELEPVSTEQVDLADASGRVLAEAIRATGDQPACDVSAMDGYALRLIDAQAQVLRVMGETEPGMPPLQTPAPGGCVRIFTGGAVPGWADAVVPRELVEESADQIVLPQALKLPPGGHVRRQGESARAGDPLLNAGHAISPVAAAALATNGVARPTVFVRVRVAVITTGNEVVPVDAEPQPWQVRDSNAAACSAFLSTLPWVRLSPPRRIRDDRAALRAACMEALAAHDVLIVTGGVSVGDHDHTPAALEDAGCRTLYHRVLMRPGKPNLGALGPQGQAVLGLPGNPQSVLVGLRVMVLAALRRRAGFANIQPPGTAVMLEPSADRKTLGMWWYRPVRLTDAGMARLANSTGSGDTTGPASSDGLIELPPNTVPGGPHRYLAWSA